MKQINNYILEKFKINSNNIETYKPKDRKELREIVIKLINENGPDADLNCIDTSKITDMNHLFSRFASKVGNVDVSSWDVSNVEDMAYMFADCKKFNCDIGNWNVQNVKDMCCMFADCDVFNQDLNNWDVSNVENFSEMFENCKEFNSDLSEWKLNSAKDVQNMFFGAKKFQGKGLNKWKLPQSCWKRGRMLTDTAIRNKDIFD